MMSQNPEEQQEEQDRPDDNMRRAGAFESCCKICLFVVFLLFFWGSAHFLSFLGSLNGNVSSGFAMVSRCDQMRETLDHTPPPKRFRSVHSVEEALTPPSRLWYCPVAVLAGGGGVMVVVGLWRLWHKRQRLNVFFWFFAPVLFAGAGGLEWHISKQRELRGETLQLVQQFDASVQKARQMGISPAVIAESLETPLSEFGYTYESATSGFATMRRVIAAIDGLAR